MKTNRRGFLSKIFAGAIAAPAITKIIAAGNGTVPASRVLTYAISFDPAAESWEYAVNFHPDWLTPPPTGMGWVVTKKP